MGLCIGRGLGCPDNGERMGFASAPWVVVGHPERVNLVVFSSATDLSTEFIMSVLFTSICMTFKLQTIETI
jgi:hypothetical protein